MGNWADNLEAMAAAVVDPAAFGETVTLPDGRTALGVVDLPGPPAGAMGSEVGLRMRVSALPNPFLTLRTADAAGLQSRDRVSVRGVLYLIAEIDPDDGDLVRVALMPEPNGGPDRLAGYQ